MCPAKADQPALRSQRLTNPGQSGLQALKTTQIDLTLGSWGVMIKLTVRPSYRKAGVMYHETFRQLGGVARWQDATREYDNPISNSIMAMLRVIHRVADHDGLYGDFDDCEGCDAAVGYLDFGIVNSLMVPIQDPPYTDWLLAGCLVCDHIPHHTGTVCNATLIDSDGNETHCDCKAI